MDRDRAGHRPGRRRDAVTGVRRSGTTRRARLLVVGALAFAAFTLTGWPAAATAGAVPAGTGQVSGWSQPGRPRLDPGAATGAAGAAGAQSSTAPVPGGQSGAPGAVPGVTDVSRPAPQPAEVEQPAEDEGGGLGLLMLGIAVVAAIGAGVLLAVSRRRPAAAAGVASGRARIAWGTPGFDTTAPVAAPAAGGRTVADAVREAQHLEVLTAALQVVAVHGPSDAIRQQVERLLNGSRVRREDLVDSCVRYRDQLAERDPALAAHLLAALAQVGVTEVVADGDEFDPHRHQSMDVQDTPHAYLRDVVATTIRPGYLDNGRVLRLPEVIVYRFVPTGGREEQPWNPAR